MFRRPHFATNSKRRRTRTIETLEHRQMMAADAFAFVDAVNLDLPPNQADSVQTPECRLNVPWEKLEAFLAVRGGRSTGFAESVEQTSVVWEAVSPAAGREAVDRLTAELEQHASSIIAGLEKEIEEWDAWRARATKEVQQSIRADIKGWTDRIDKLKRELKSLAGEKADAEEAIAWREEKIAELQGDIRDWKHDIGKWKDRVDDLKDRLGRFAPSWIKKDINKLKNKIDDQYRLIETAAERIEQYAEEIAEQRELLDAIAKATASRVKSVNTLEAKVHQARKNLDREVDRIENKAAQKIQDVEAKLKATRESLQEVLSALKDQGPALAERLQRALENVDAMSRKVVEKFQSLTQEQQQSALAFIEANDGEMSKDGDAVTRFKSWWVEKVKEPLVNGGWDDELATAIKLHMDNAGPTVIKGLIGDYVRAFEDFGNRMDEANRSMDRGDEKQGMGRAVQAMAYLCVDLYGSTMSAQVMFIGNHIGMVCGAIWGRPLSESEQSFARGIFGNKIDFYRVRLIESSPAMVLGDGITLGGTIILDREAMSDTESRQLFAHELTHIYQVQREPTLNNQPQNTNGAARETAGDIITGKQHHRYEVNLNKDSKWDDLNVDQQCEVVSHYVQRLDDLDNVEGEDNEVKDENKMHYERVLREAGLFKEFLGSDAEDWPDYSLTGDAQPSVTRADNRSTTSPTATPARVELLDLAVAGYENRWVEI